MSEEENQLAPDENKPDKDGVLHVTLRLDAKFVYELKRRTGTSSVQDILFEALGIYEFATAQMAEGKVIVSVMPDGSGNPITIYSKGLENAKTG